MKLNTNTTPLGHIDEFAVNEETRKGETKGKGALKEPKGEESDSSGNSGKNDESHAQIN